MITDEERREVAKKLRGVEVVSFDDGEMCDGGDIALALRLETDYGEWYTADSVKRLAELIDRPTTSRNKVFKTKYGRKVPACECCGFSIGDGRWSYCPNCGAEVTR